MNTLVNYKVPAVDTLGDLLAQMSKLQAEVDLIKDALKAEGPGAYEGEQFKATVIVSNRSNIDFKQVFAECSVPAEIIARNTKVQEVVSVKLTSR
jgi:hypothetical protein